MKMLITVPSKGRAYAIDKRTLKWLPDVKSPIQTDWKVFVEPQDYRYYKQTVPTDHLITLPDNDQGLSYVVKCVREYALKEGYDLVMWLDDDCTGYVRCDGKDPARNCEAFLSDVLGYFESMPDVGNIGTIDNVSGYMLPVIRKNLNSNNKITVGWKPAYSVYIIRAELLTYDLRLKSRIDVMVNLGVWAQGYRTVMYNYTAMNHEQQTNGGGLNYDHKQRVLDNDAACDIICEHYPLCVKQFVTADNTRIGQMARQYGLGGYTSLNLDVYRHKT